MEIGDRITCIELIRKKDRSKPETRITTGIIITTREGSCTLDRDLELQILSLSGSLPDEAPDTIWYREAVLKAGRVEEWQHRNSVRPMELARAAFDKEVRKAINKIKEKNFRIRRARMRGSEAYKLKQASNASASSKNPPGSGR